MMGIRREFSRLYASALAASLHQSDPRSEKAAAALCRVEALAYAAYGILLERSKAD
jgi:hypothetical protein